MLLTSLTRSLGTTTTTITSTPCLRRAQFSSLFTQNNAYKRLGLTLNLKVDVDVVKEKKKDSETRLGGAGLLFLRWALGSCGGREVVEPSTTKPFSSLSTLSRVNSASAAARASASASATASASASTLKTRKLPWQTRLVVAKPFSTTSTLSTSTSLPNTTSKAKPEPETPPILTPPSVSTWLLLSSGLVFTIIVVGGVTRLTESGLSITEWKPITGIVPPLSYEEWMEEFEKYKATPEFKLLNSTFTLDDFKRIFYMEWGHRVLGRLIGLSFVFPLAYFIARKKVSFPVALKLTSLSLLIGFQGFLGWYMVKSGLEEIEEPGGVPRVSQYRLAAHLGTALALYIGMFGMGLKAIREWKWVKTGVGASSGWSGIVGNQETVEKLLGNPQVRRFRGAALALAGLVLVTALSGAFVAGLDAGLVYNEFPLMGGRLAPPTDELFSPAYAKSLDKSDLWWRNIFENPTTVQFDHRVLAITTYLSTTALFFASRRPHMRAVLPPLARTATTLAFAMANIQVLLGISTLLYLVPVPLAATHQAGSVALLSAMVNLLVTLRRPGMAARFWRGKTAK
ncbi:COX15-CtaA-domain-containing protein [Pluteus cervinus]|uniref:COX15-CtaA-domain-containing protein n=1 Tax=Pluteus cervinus TaxID=181527 RepID=A0ACD3B852_9AGAR|nr:COX15-CtaA-domain-containing protein [Pluteus cervinus]